MGERSQVGKGEPNFLKDGDLIEFPFQCVFKFRVNEGVEPNYGTPKHRLKKGEKSAAASKKKKEEVGRRRRSGEEEEEAKEVVLPVPAAKKRASPEKRTWSRRRRKKRTKKGRRGDWASVAPSKKGKSVWASKTAPMRSNSRRRKRRRRKRTTTSFGRIKRKPRQCDSFGRGNREFEKSNETVSRERDEFWR